MEAPGMTASGRLALIAAIAFALAGCLSEAGEDPRPAPEAGDPWLVYPYVVEGDRILASSYPDTSTDCLNDSLIRFIQNSFPFSMRFIRSGSTLSLVDHTDTLSSGAVVERLLILKRVSGGSGLEGTWRYADTEYEVTAGSLSAEEKAGFDSDLERFRYGYSLLTLDYVIGGGFVRIFRIDERTAEWLQSVWNGAFQPPGSADSLRYDMDFRIVDKHTVEYHGRKTGETVRLTRKPNGDMDFSSDNPAHPEVRYIVNPKHCPAASDIPQWYWDFKRANEKGSGETLPKRG